MLIVEGSDNLGKTTFCKRAVELAKKLEIPAEYRHMGRPAPEFTFGREYFDMVHPMAIQDRFHVGSLIWHEGVMTASKLSVIEGHIRVHGGLIVFFWAPQREWYRDRLKSSTKAELFGVDKLLLANDTYVSLAGRHADIVVPIGPSEDGPDFPNDDTIVEILKEWKARLQFAGEFPCNL